MHGDRFSRDQLFFDRINTSIPVLHHRHYLSWAKHATKNPSRDSLQCAIWTLASLSSAQFRHLQNVFYQRARQMLDSLSLGSYDQDPMDVEQVQAWILLAVYESSRAQHQQAWLSAGRAFRGVQLMRLHEIDIPAQSSNPQGDFVETEEKRRVFWMAYFFDHLFSMRNDWPITLSEHMVGLFYGGTER